MMTWDKYTLKEYLEEERLPLDDWFRGGVLGYMSFIYGFFVWPFPANLVLTHRSMIQRGQFKSS